MAGADFWYHLSKLLDDGTSGERKAAAALLNVPLIANSLTTMLGTPSLLALLTENIL